ncbi:5'-methylthioadenosine/adenosylhomocysteine nucleosidase [Bacillus carboniphilus]|uniref:adenosylhomocysteine nucleosidase n=1 Tax=Bacillus carboniphilus TaxID=86663 RepID=A0ABN0WHL0_9BACI
MKKIGIMGALQVEIDILLEKMDAHEKRTVAGFPFYCGKLYGNEVIITCCGVGKVNAAACTQALIDKFGVNYIINTGIAGSIRSEIRVCDVVISSDVTHHDVRKDQMTSLFPFQEVFQANGELIQMAKEACMSTLEKNKHHIGRIVSGEAFVSTTQLKNDIKEAYQPACVEMEGSAIGHVAFLNDVPFVVIRSISDNADEEAEMSFEAFEEIAAHQSAGVVLEMVKQMNLSEGYVKRS